MFAPVNSDHAITTAVFSVNFAAAVPEAVLNAIQSRHDLWRTDLPAMRPANSLSIEVTPQGPVVHTGPGVDFAFLRPDGSPAWSLRVVGQELTVECTRYTRWDAVAAQALGHLRKAFTVISGVQPTLLIESIALIFQDDFFWMSSEDDYDLSKLFTQSDLMSGHVFSAGPVWHSYIAWFETNAVELPPDHPTLVHVNVTGTRDSQMALERGASAQVNVANLQNMRLTAPMQISELEANSDLVGQAFEAMHARNKSILTTVLTTETAKQIGLT